MCEIQLTDADIEKIKTTMSNMSVEELKEAVKAIPAGLMWDELRKRYEERTEILNNISTHFNICDQRFS